MKEYLYDVFLSFTGLDRSLKASIRKYLESQGLDCYDSDEINTGDFRDHYCEGIDKSRVYLLVLTDSLYNDPAKTGRGFISEVRKEVNLALECEAANELNIVILCLSEFFNYGSTFHDYNDSIGWYFYTHTRSYSQVSGVVDSDGMLSEQTLAEVESRCRQFVDKRNAGVPAPSLSPKLDIAESKLPERKLFVGREDEISEAINAFEAGKQAVVLRGPGGMGKTHLATEIARRCNENGNLYCPQIVYIGECSDRDGIHTLTSSVSYTRAVYEGLSFLSEHDRFKRKLRALAELPEYVLLVVDNYNAIKQTDLTDLLDNLKCRLLITTRARLEADTNISVVSVEMLCEDSAYDMFCRTCGSDKVDRDEFSCLYKFVGGHTMTLCIIAKMISLHKNSISDIINGMKDLGAMEEKIDFVHNDYRESDTILGHLTYLFGMNNFSEGGKRILRSMSILETGMIETSVLMHVLKLKNRNEIAELLASGWLDVMTRRSENNEIEFLCIHPIISLLMANLLVPTEDNVSEMATHISETADRMREKMTYADAAVLDESLYYACRILARGSNKLPLNLWNSLVTVNHILGDEENTERKTRELSAVISNPSDSARITMYSDMVILEQHPTRTDVIEKYLEALEKNSNDYKWVLRCLSVTLPHIIGVSKHHLFLSRALETAVDAAIYYNDDFAIFDLTAYTCYLKKDLQTKIINKIKHYLKKRKKDGVKSATLILIEMILQTYNKKGIESTIRSYINVANNVLIDQNNSLIRDFIKNPIIYIKSYRLGVKLSKIEEDSLDPCSYPFKMLYGRIESSLDEGKINAHQIIEAAVQLQISKYEHQISLAPMEKTLEGLLYILKALPEHAVSYEVEQLSSTVSTDEISVRELSKLRVAAQINLAYNKPEAILQSKRLISILRKQRPEGHPDIISAMVAHADTCLKFNRPEQALLVYLDAFNTLKKKSSDSSQYIEIARQILKTHTVKYSEQHSMLERILKKMSRRSEKAQSPSKPDNSGFLSLSQLKELFEIALTETDITHWQYHFVVYNYAYMLLSMVKFESITTADPVFDELFNAIDEIFDHLKKLDKTTKMNYATLLHSISRAASNENNGNTFDRSQSLLMKLHKKCKGIVSFFAYSFRLNACAIDKYQRKEDDFTKLFHQNVVYCIQKKLPYNHTLGNVYNIIELANVSDHEELIRLLIKKKSNLEKIDALIKDINAQNDKNCVDLFMIRYSNRTSFKNFYGLSTKEYKKVKNAEELYILVLEEILLNIFPEELSHFSHILAQLRSNQ